MYVIAGDANKIPEAYGGAGKTKSVSLSLVILSMVLGSSIRLIRLIILSTYQICFTYTGTVGTELRREIGMV